MNNLSFEDVLQKNKVNLEDYISQIKSNLTYLSKILVKSKHQITQLKLSREKLMIAEHTLVQVNKQLKERK